MKIAAVQLRPHVENHGKHSIEWSYHFPLQAGLIIESQFDVSFVGEKISGAAKSSLSQSNIANTRLSFADSAASIRALSLQFLSDCLLLHNSLLQVHEGSESRGTDLTPAEQTAIQFITQQWTPSFFGKLGIILQSDLKYLKRQLRQALRARKTFQARDLAWYGIRKGALLSSFRSAHRLIHLRFVWEKILQSERSSLIFPTQNDDLNLSVRFYQRICDLSELALSLIGTAVAEFQNLVNDAQRASKEHISMIRRSGPDSLIDEDVLEQFELQELEFLKGERKWLASWAVTCNDLRIKSKFHSFSEVANDDRLAAQYFDRIRSLKKQHYQVFDLDVALVPNDKKIEFWIGAGAAGISAFFAFLFLIFLNIGQISFGSRSAITLGVFLFGNTVIYIAKDRLKEWLKISLRSFLHLRSGKWSGVCKLDVGNETTGIQRTVEITRIERETWWSQSEETWKFHVWEEFSVVTNAESTGARIIKQGWRLPLDEILHTLDNSKHILKLPGIEGEPREVPVLKQGEFPFQLRVRVKKKENGKELEIDSASAIGCIQTAGDSIVLIITN